MTFLEFDFTVPAESKFRLTQREDNDKALNPRITRRQGSLSSMR